MTVVNKFLEGVAASLEKTAGYDKATLSLLRKAVEQANAGDTLLLSALKKLHSSPHIKLSPNISETSAIKYKINPKINALRTDIQESRAGAFSNVDDEFTRAFKEVGLEDVPTQSKRSPTKATDYVMGTPNYKSGLADLPTIVDGKIY